LIANRKIGNKRIFNGKNYITDFFTYGNRNDAKSVVIFLKTKEVAIRARIVKIEPKKDSPSSEIYLIYFDEDTYNRIKYGTLKIPSIEKIPLEIQQSVKLEKSEAKTPKINIKVQPSHVKSTIAPNVMEIKSKYMYGRTETYQVVKLDKDASKTDLLVQNNTSTIVKENPENEDTPEGGESLENGIKTVLDYVENEFFGKCPKCNSEMRPNFLVLGPRGRLSVYQCNLCKFYLPRNLVMN
jgi:hypothetical protein